MLTIIVQHILWFDFSCNHHQSLLVIVGVIKYSNNNSSDTNITADRYPVSALECNPWNLTLLIVIHWHCWKWARLLFICKFSRSFCQSSPIYLDMNYEWTSRPFFKRINLTIKQRDNESHSRSRLFSHSRRLSWTTESCLGRQSLSDGMCCKIFYAKNIARVKVEWTVSRGVQQQRQLCA